MKRTLGYKRVALAMLPLLIIVGLSTQIVELARGAPILTHHLPAHIAPKIIYYPTRPVWQATHHTITPKAQGSGDLVYNGGRVLENPVTYAIFWGSYWNNGSGGVTADAQVVLKYFSDLGTTQFENILSQYNDTVNSIANTHQLAAYWNDTAAPPTDTACSGNPTVEDASIGNEVNHAIAVNGWPTDTSNAVYVVYTPPNDYVHAGSACSAQQFCAYHTFNGSVSYAAEPYPVLTACPAVQSPNGNAAGDSLVNTSSHEQFESISDPFPCGYGCSATGWVDSANYEIGDKCAWDFSSGYTNLNNSGTFYMQTEYSNVSHTCVNAYNSPPHVRVTPSSLAITTTSTTLSSRQLALENTSWNTLTWSANSLPVWIAVSPTSGSLAAGSTQQLTLSFNITSYTPQTYTTQLSLSGNADNAPFTVPISVVVQGGALNVQVNLWPSSPACYLSDPCTMPLPNRQVTILTLTGAMVSTAMTDQQGTLSLALVPGSYVIRVAMSAGLAGLKQIPPSTVSVVVGQTTSQVILVDSGIR